MAVSFSGSDSGPEGFTSLGSVESVVLRGTPGQSVGRSVRQRFTLAHELGHVALHRRIGLVAGKEAYWAYERWCDRFASHLLLPRQQLESELPDKKETSWAPYLFLPGRLASKADVSISVAAHALAAIPDFKFDYLRLREGKNGLKVELSTISSPANLGVGALVRDPLDRAAFEGILSGSVARFSLGSPLGKLDLSGRELLIYRGLRDWLVMLRRQEALPNPEPIQTELDF